MKRSQENGATNNEESPTKKVRETTTTTTTDPTTTTTNTTTGTTTGTTTTATTTATTAPVAAVEAWRNEISVSCSSEDNELFTMKAKVGKYDYKQKIEQQEELIKRLRAHARATEAKRATLVALCVAVDATIRDIETGKSSTEAELAAARARAAEAHDEAARLVAAVAKVDAERKALDARVTRLCGDLSRAEESLALEEGRSAELTAQNHVASKQLEEKEVALADRTARLEAERAAGDQVRRQLAEITETHRRAVYDAAEAARAAAQTIAEATTRVAVLEASVASANENLARAHAATGRAQGQLDALTEQHTAVVARLAQKEDEFGEASRQFVRASERAAEQLAQVTAERRDAEDKLSAARVELAEARAEAERLRAEREALAAEVALLVPVRDEAVVLRADLARVLGEHARAQEEAASLREEVATLKQHSGKGSAEQMELICALQRDSNASARRIDELSATAAEVAALRQANAELAKARLASDEERRRLHNDIQDLKGKVRVMARVRPTLPHEADVEKAKIVVPAPDKIRLDARGKEYGFTVDRVFGPESTQADVFDEVSTFVQSALDGYKVCLFAYGQTGSGKTFTMQGDGSSCKGIIHRAVDKIFAEAANLALCGWKVDTQASFMEIYNDQIRDLLTAQQADKQYYIKHDDDGNTTVSGLTYVPVQGAGEIDGILRTAGRNRSTSSTNMNEQSSRSHAVFVLDITATNALAGTTLRGSLNLVDLAGSERIDKSGATGQALKEAQNINGSLTSLARVLTALADKAGHIPFRDSKLTYFLQPCLSGSGKTLMLTNLSPVEQSSGETLCTLQFGATVKKVETGKVKKNVVQQQQQDDEAADKDETKGKETNKRPLTAPTQASQAQATKKPTLTKK